MADIPGAKRTRARARCTVEVCSHPSGGAATWSGETGRPSARDVCLYRDGREKASRIWQQTADRSSQAVCTDAAYAARGLCCHMCERSLEEERVFGCEAAAPFSLFACSLISRPWTSACVASLICIHPGHPLLLCSFHIPHTALPSPCLAPPHHNPPSHRPPLCPPQRPRGRPPSHTTTTSRTGRT